MKSLWVWIITLNLYPVVVTKPNCSTDLVESNKAFRKIFLANLLARSFYCQNPFWGFFNFEAKNTSRQCTLGILFRGPGTCIILHSIRGLHQQRSIRGRGLLIIYHQSTHTLTAVWPYKVANFKVTNFIATWLQFYNWWEGERHCRGQTALKQASRDKTSFSHCNSPKTSQENTTSFRPLVKPLEDNQNLLRSLCLDHGCIWVKRWLSCIMNFLCSQLL